MTSVAENVEQVQKRVTDAARACGREPQEVLLLAVAKRHSVDAIREALDCGLTDIGESYMQEALPKIEALADTNVVWHFIGPLQSNKTRPIAAHFDWVHSVAKLSHARRLSDQRPAELPDLNICLQVNISGEASKSGVTPDALPDLARQVADLPRLRLRGLMAIPAATDNPDQQHAAFAAVRRCFDDLQQAGLAVDTLSMGMSGDLEAAIAEGATIIRIGTAIFGPRIG